LAVVKGRQNWPIPFCHFFSPTIIYSPIGCGTGRHALRLADAGARVTAVDFSEAMLQCARAKSGAEAITFVLHDGIILGLPHKARLVREADFQEVCLGIEPNTYFLGHSFAPFFNWSVGRRGPGSL
jgi:SAM-dependent methyltransferase